MSLLYLWVVGQKSKNLGFLCMICPGVNHLTTYYGMPSTQKSITDWQVQLHIPLMTSQMDNRQPLNSLHLTKTRLWASSIFTPISFFCFLYVSQVHAFNKAKFSSWLAERRAEASFGKALLWRDNWRDDHGLPSEANVLSGKEKRSGSSPYDVFLQYPDGWLVLHKTSLGQVSHAWSHRMGTVNLAQVVDCVECQKYHEITLVTVLSRVLNLITLLFGWQKSLAIVKLSWVQYWGQDLGFFLPSQLELKVLIFMQNWILGRSLLISLEVSSNVIRTSDGLQPRYKGFTFIVLLYWVSSWICVLRCYCIYHCCCSICSSLWVFFQGWYLPSKKYICQMVEVRLGWTLTSL